MITLIVLMFLIAKWSRIGVHPLLKDGEPWPLGGKPVDARARVLDDPAQRGLVVVFLVVTVALWVWLGDLAELRAHQEAGGGWPGALAAGMELRSFAMLAWVEGAAELFGLYLLYAAAGAEPIVLAWRRALERWRAVSLDSKLGAWLALVLGAALWLGLIGWTNAAVLSVCWLGGVGAIVWYRAVTGDRLDACPPEVSGDD